MELSTQVDTVHARTKKVLSEGDQIHLTCFFILVDEGRYDLNSIISGPTLARQRNDILMAVRWRADNGPTLNDGLVAGIRTSIAFLLRSPIF